ncbi:MerR family transcriptional regulator [Mycobacterium sp. URHD0025]|uniref:helix-turn-helix domain-containing protein n=1 Tax=Mycobacterium sp. URHD0025 TaxID=1298864 RepID=UPI00042243CF|nr:MerR family transcriptional regulator [Mycobacterium sp. URHD0025]
MGEAYAVGVAAAAVGVESHVLRHWEDVGVLVPSRSASGHRRYDDELIARARLVRLCQHAGLTLAEIRDLRAADRDDRIDMISATLERIRGDISRLQRAAQFLTHVVACVHPVISECPDCAGFAQSAR